MVVGIAGIGVAIGLFVNPAGIVSSWEFEINIRIHSLFITPLHYEQIGEIMPKLLRNAETKEK